MSDIRNCPHCNAHLELVSETLNWTKGKVHFRSWLCRSCGVRQETRKIGNEPEETLLTSKPRAVIDAAHDARMEQERLGHEQFQAKGGRHVERKHA